MNTFHPWLCQLMNEHVVWFVELQFSSEDQRLSKYSEEEATTSRDHR